MATHTQRVLLDCPHHHVIFTLPSELHPLWLYNREIMTNILFQATQDTLKQFSKDPKYLDAVPGMLCTLHTWGRNLSLHPHIHVLLSHGGINAEGEWVEPRKAVLFPQKPVMQVFRGKLRDLIKKAMKDDPNWVLPPDRREHHITALLNKLAERNGLSIFVSATTTRRRSEVLVALCEIRSAEELTNHRGDRHPRQLPLQIA